MTEVKPASEPTCEWCGRYLSDHMNAYYYGFSETGCKDIDRVLCSVASAGKAYHHTEDWTDEYTGLIQSAAEQASATIERLTRERDEALADVRRLEIEGPTPNTDAIAAKGRRIIEERLIRERDALEQELVQRLRSLLDERALRRELQRVLEKTNQELRAVRMNGDGISLAVIQTADLALARAAEHDAKEPK